MWRKSTHPDTVYSQWFVESGQWFTNLVWQMWSKRLTDHLSTLCLALTWETWKNGPVNGPNGPVHGQNGRLHFDPVNLTTTIVLRFGSPFVRAMAGPKRFTGSCHFAKETKILGRHL